jgi:putative ABC transport system substrate-binding protein
MDRRVFLGTLAGGLVAVPLAVQAQPRMGVPRVGIVSLTPRSGVYVKEFEDDMSALGYVEGRDIAYDHRFADLEAERLARLLAEMVRLKVDVIVALNTAVALAARKETQTIPIVMVLSPDPVGAGLVTSLARPGGNVTGATLQFPDVARKRVEFLKETVPALSHLSVVWDPTFSDIAGVVRETVAGASHVGLHSQVLEARSPSELESAFAAIPRQGRRAVVVYGSDMLFVHRVRIAELATRAQLAALCPFREFVEAGCLMSYSANVKDLYRRAATYVDKILKGAKPGDLPIEQPTKFEFVINLKTAKALGLTIPPSLLHRADQVIE